MSGWRLKERNGGDLGEGEREDTVGRMWDGIICGGTFINVMSQYIKMHLKERRIAKLSFSCSSL